MNFIGIDLHKKTISVCVMNQDRKVLKRQTLPCLEPEPIVAFFRQWGEFQAVVEATASYEWLWQLLEPLARRLVLAHPKKLRGHRRKQEQERPAGRPGAGGLSGTEHDPGGVPSYASSTSTSKLGSATVFCEEEPDAGAQQDSTSLKRLQCRPSGSVHPSGVAIPARGQEEVLGS